MARAASARPEREAESGTHKTAATGGRAAGTPDSRRRRGKDGDVRATTDGVSGCYADRERRHCNRNGESFHPSKYIAAWKKYLLRNSPFSYVPFQSMSEKKKRSQKSEVHMDTLRQLMDYLTHFKLTVAIDRNLHLLQTMKNPKPGARNPKPEEFVRVFDILLQVSFICVL